MAFVFEDKLFQTKVRAKGGGFQYHLGVYLDDVLKANIDNYLKRGVDKGHDAIILVTGLEGSGKSSFAQLIAAYCDGNNSLSIDRIVFSGKELMRAIDVAPPKSAIIFDEAILDLASSDSATEMQRILIKKFTLIRKKRLFIFLIIPSMFMLRRYFVIFRTRCMINCVCPDGITRGYFRFYSFITKKNLYLRGYKEMDMGAVRYDFRGRFIDSYGLFIDAKEYEDKKDKAINELTSDKNDIHKKYREMVEEYKEKVKYEVLTYKDKLIKKVFEERNKAHSKVEEIKTMHQTKMKEVKDNALLFQRQRDKTHLDKLNTMYVKLLFFAYQQVKNQMGVNFTIGDFRNMLLSECVSADSYGSVKGFLEDGEKIINMTKKGIINIDEKIKVDSVEVK